MKTLVSLMETLTDRLELDGEDGVPDVVGDPAAVVPVLVDGELLDDEGAPDHLPLLALHDGEVPRLAPSPQLLPLKCFS